VASLYEIGGAVLDGGGRSLTLLDPARLLRRAVELVSEAAASGPDAAPIAGREPA
jgi:hypothetical protein